MSCGREALTDWFSLWSAVSPCDLRGADHIQSLLAISISSSTNDFGGTFDAS